MKKIFIVVFILLLCGCEKNEPELFCEKGILENNKCKIVQTSEPAYQCEESYTEDKKSKKCVNTITIQAKQVSTCPNGYEIGNDYWCYSTERFEKETKKECISKNIKDDDKLSSTYVKEDKCYEKLCTKKSEDGKECLEFKETELEFKEEKVCPSDTYSIKGECRKKSWMNKDISCELGTLKDDKCIIEDVVDKKAVCEEDYTLNNDVCEKVSYEAPILK